MYGDPHFKRSLIAEVVEGQRGKEAYRTLGNTLARLGERIVFRGQQLGESVESTPDALQITLAAEAIKVDARNTMRSKVARPDESKFAGQLNEARPICVVGHVLQH